MFVLGILASFNKAATEILLISKSKCEMGRINELSSRTNGLDNFYVIYSYSLVQNGNSIKTFVFTLLKRLIILSSLSVSVAGSYDLFTKIHFKVII